LSNFGGPNAQTQMDSDDDDDECAGDEVAKARVLSSSLSLSPPPVEERKLKRE